MRVLTRFSVCLLVLWLLLPLLPLVIWSFARGWRFPDLLPQSWSLQAWEYLLSPISGIGEAFWQTTLIAGASTALAMLVGIPAGRALGQYRFRGQTLVQILVLAPIIVPGIATALGLHAVFLQFSLTGSLLGVILVHLVPVLPYVILVVSGLFANLDQDFERQARNLGASSWQAFLHVTLPQVAPGLVVAALFSFLVSWSQYILTLLIGSGQVETLPLLLFNFAASGRNDIAGALSLLYILPGALILLVTARHLSASGATLGRP